MGLINRNYNSTLFITIRDGKIIVPVEQPTDTSVQRTNKMGRTVNEEQYEQLNAVLQRVELRKNDKYGNQWCVHLMDSATLEQFSLQLPESGGNTWSLLNRLLNVNKDEEISIQPYCFIPAGETKERRGCTVRRMDNTKVEPYVTRDNAQGCPDIIPVEFKGETRYDDTARIAWLAAKFTEKFGEQQAQSNTPQNAPNIVEPDTDTEPTDLPF
ncbi:MAG: hypothetical protein LBG17_00205 [Bacteroidales bacterium]|jgi:hypothetical protein|nr:hypothetical protein [Bacteroidales bacterium]